MTSGENSFYGCGEMERLDLWKLMQQKERGGGRPGKSLLWRCDVGVKLRPPPHHHNQSGCRTMEPGSHPANGMAACRGRHCSEESTLSPEAE